MAKSVGFNVKIGGDVSGLQKALKSANAGIREAERSLKSLNKLTKLDPNNLTAYQEKQKALQQELKATEDGFRKLQAGKKDMDQALADGKISSKDWADYNEQLLKAEENYKKLQKATNEYIPSIAMMQDKLDNVSKSLKDFAEKTKGLSLAGGAVATTLIGGAINAGKMADDLNTLAKQSGFTTEQLQKMNYAQDLIDVSTQTIVKASAKMTKQLTSNGKLFDELGIKTKDANGQFLSTNEIFNNSIKVLSNVQNETERDRLAMELFGKSANELAGVIDDGGEALNKIGKEAQETGLILSQDALDGANAFNDGLDRMKAQMQQAFFSGGANLSKSLIPAMEKLGKSFQGVMQWVSKLDGKTLEMILKIALVVAAISPVLGAMAKVTSGISGMIGMIGTMQGAYKTMHTVIQEGNSGLAKGIKGLFTLISSHPVVAISVAIIGALITMYNKCEWFRNGVNAVFNGIGDAISVFINWVKKSFDWIGKLWEKMSQTQFAKGVIEVFNTMIEVVNWLCDAFSNLFGWIGEVWDSMSNFVGGIGESIGGFFGGLFGGSEGIGFEFAPFSSGGLGTPTNIDLQLSTTISVNNQGNAIDDKMVGSWGKKIADVVSYELGRRL